MSHYLKVNQSSRTLHDTQEQGCKVSLWKAYTPLFKEIRCKVCHLLKYKTFFQPISSWDIIHLLNSMKKNTTFKIMNNKIWNYDQKNPWNIQLVGWTRNNAKVDHNKCAEGVHSRVMLIYM